MDYGFEGAIVYIDQKGKTPALFTAGWHNRELKIPTKPNALFKIASIGKLYDAAAISKLANDRLLSLDNNLAHYFPDLLGKIDNADEIREVSQPFFWIHGEQDDFIDFESHGQVVWNNYQGSRGIAVPVPGADHGDVVGIMGQAEYRAAVLQFLEE